MMSGSPTEFELEYQRVSRSGHAGAGDEPLAGSRSDPNLRGYQYIVQIRYLRNKSKCLYFAIRIQLNAHAGV